ncbi:hypothetical protein [Halorubrum sp. F4]|uniref:hypothetical protein n=1 Tax=Halorubrum sp. F4 TaxID=2989715 RepID=UPI00247FA224|nr:hypothetical protein [Halorubrum sp. F4]
MVLPLELESAGQVLPNVTLFRFYIIWFIAVLSVLLYDNYELVQQESGAFADDYKQSSLGWLSSIGGSFLAVTIGRDSAWASIIIASVFVVPAVFHAYRKYPFSLFCNYIAYDPDSGKRDISKSKQGIATQQDDDSYTIDLEIETGTAIDTYAIEVSLPEGVEITHDDPPPGEHELTDDNVITGKSSNTKPEFTFGLILEVTSGLDSVGENFVVLTDQGTGRVLEQVELVPNS